jgi:hypothetical protein
MDARRIASNSKIVPPIFGHGLTEEKVEEIGDDNDQMRVTTRAAKQGRSDRANRKWELN